MYEIYPENEPEKVLKHLFDNLKNEDNLVIKLHDKYLKTEQLIFESYAELKRDLPFVIRDYHEGNVIDLNKELNEIINKIKSFIGTPDYDNYIDAIKTYEAFKIIKSIQEIYEHDHTFYIRSQNNFNNINWKSLIDQIKKGEISTHDIYDRLKLDVNNKTKKYNTKLI